MVGYFLKAFSAAHGLVRALYTLVVLALIALILGSAAYMVMAASGWLRSASHVIANPIANITGAAPIPSNVPEIVSDERLKCRSYAMLADFEGSTHRYDADKLRILRTIAEYSRVEGVDECEVFHLQMELVMPGTGKRSKGIFSVPDRAFAYIEMTFSDAARHEAFLLAQAAARSPDTAWKAIVIVRPDRSWTFGNQSSAEVSAIESGLQEVRLDVPSDFRFFKPKTQ